MTTNSRNHLRPALRLCVAALALASLAACGDDDGTSVTDAGASSTPSTATSDTATSEAPTSEAPTSDAPTSDAPSDAPTSDAPTSDPSDAPTQEPRLIGYAGGESAGVYVQDRADLKKLTGSPQDFKTFIGGVVDGLSGGCDAAAIGVTVEFVRTDGYAVGGVSDCGGYQALWAVVDGAWQEIDGTQDTWDCKVLKKYTVPSDIAGDSCYDYHGDHQEHAYHQA